MHADGRRGDPLVVLRVVGDRPDGAYSRGRNRLGVAEAPSRVVIPGAAPTPRRACDL